MLYAWKLVEMLKLLEVYLPVSRGLNLNSDSEESLFRTLQVRSIYGVQQRQALCEDDVWLADLIVGLLVIVQRNTSFIYNLEYLRQEGLASNIVVNSLLDPLVALCAT
mmetsp:Transcript_5907/g.9201  ORF Transcript_5907/g.9201 Transcript_5907/m.9201 type:complete len:108 (+) Transcript_5907:2220-2543(+)